MPSRLKYWLVKNVITKRPKAVKSWNFFYKPSYKVMSNPRFFIEWTNIDTLIAINMVHPFICLGPIFVPILKAFLSVKRRFGRDVSFSRREWPAMDNTRHTYGKSRRIQLLRNQWGLLV
jgi:uncharacterized membrane protein